MRQVVWNELAKADYFDNIDYLLGKWTPWEAQNFIDEVDEIIFILKQGNVEYQETDYPGIRRCVLRSQVTIFYRETGKQSVELLRFWNNYQDEGKLKFK